MSELFCPAVLVLARHGEADSERARLSDDGGSLTPSGRRHARELAERLAGDRVAAVWSSDGSCSVQTAEIAAAALGHETVTVVSWARETSLAGLRAPLETVADQYRGETVLLVTSARAIRVVVSQLCVNVRHLRSWDLPHGRAARISAGDEPWRLQTWADERLEG